MFLGLTCFKYWKIQRIENLQDELTRLKNAENQYALSRPTHVINNNAAKVF